MKSLRVMPPHEYSQSSVGARHRRAADLPIEFHQFAGQGLKPAELGNLPFGFAHGWLRREILSLSLSADLLGELKVRTVSSAVRLGAMAPGFSAAADGAGDGARLEVAEFRDLSEQSGAVVKQGQKRVDH
jgi:hypothetical protein